MDSSPQSDSAATIASKRHADLVLNGVFDQDNYNRWFEKLVDIRRNCPELVRLHIESPGGNPAFVHRILDFLRTRSHYGITPRLVGIVPSLAASAATDLLLKCDYAIAFPQAELHFHGSRLFDQILTAERAEQMRRSLVGENDSFAHDHAKVVAKRLAWLMVTHDPDQRQLTNAAEFSNAIHRYFKTIEAIRSNFSFGEFLWAKIENAFDQLRFFIKAEDLAADKERQGDANIERIAHDVVLELCRGPGPGFSEMIARDASFLVQMRSRGYSWLHEDLLQLIQTLFELQRVPRQNLSDIEISRMLWTFAFMLLRQLYEGENSLSAETCYWLGLIDEIEGESESFPSLGSTISAITAIER